MKEIKMRKINDNILDLEYALSILKILKLKEDNYLLSKYEINRIIKSLNSYKSRKKRFFSLLCLSQLSNEHPNYSAMIKNEFPKEFVAFKNAEVKPFRKAKTKLNFEPESSPLTICSQIIETTYYNNPRLEYLCFEIEDLKEHKNFLYHSTIEDIINKSF